MPKMRYQIGRFTGKAHTQPAWMRVARAPILIMMELLDTTPSQLEAAMAFSLGYMQTAPVSPFTHPGPHLYQDQDLITSLTITNNVLSLTLTYQDTRVFSARYSKQGYECFGPDDADLMALCSLVVAYPIDPMKDPHIHQQRVAALQAYLEKGLQ